MNQVVAVVGMCGSGKSVVTNCLEKNGWEKVYFGGVTLDAIKEQGLDITPENERMVREELRNKYGHAAYAIKMLATIKRLLEESNVVIDGLYTWSEYKYLKDSLGNQLHILCVISNREDRYKRLAERSIRPLLNKEAEERDFAEIENLEKGGPIAIADEYIINNTTIDELENQTLNYVLKIVNK